MKHFAKRCLSTLLSAALICCSIGMNNVQAMADGIELAIDNNLVGGAYVDAPSLGDIDIEADEGTAQSVSDIESDGVISPDDAGEKRLKVASPSVPVRQSQNEAQPHLDADGQPQADGADLPQINGDDQTQHDNLELPLDDILDQIPVATSSNMPLTSMPAPASEGGYKLVYHLNAPDKEDERVEAETDKCTVSQESGTFILESVGNSKSQSTIFSNNNQKENLIKGQYKHSNETLYYFAGWDADKLPVDTSYEEVDYPVCDFNGTDNRSFVNNDDYTITFKEEGSKDLYAVWTTKPGLFGYVLSAPESKLGAAGKTEDHQKIYHYGDTGSRAPKYVVYDSGYVKGNSRFKVTTERPTCVGKTFLAWFNKTPYEGEKYVVMPGEAVTYGGENNIYSLDAVWGELSKGKDETFKYDDQEHTVTFLSDSGTENDVPFVKITGGNYDGDAKTAYDAAFSKFTFTYSVEKQDGTQVLFGADGKPAKEADETASTTTNTLPKFTEPGTYVYTVTATLKSEKVPQAYANNEETIANGIEIGKTTATLKILPALAYHTNLPSEAGREDKVYSESGDIADGGTYKYGVKQLEDAFKDDQDNKYFDGLAHDLHNGYVKINNITYYFAGWSTQKGADSYDKIDYRVSVYEEGDNKRARLLADGLEFKTDKPQADLYAIWTTQPALLGYTMTIGSGDFNGNKNKTGPVIRTVDGVKLGDNGTTTSNGAQKYVVLNEGYVYDENADGIKVVESIPVDSVADPYKFVAWYNKKYGAERGKDGYNSHNTDDPFIFPGGTVYFGNTNTVFSLDAVWAKVNAKDDHISYDGAPHGLQNAVIDIQLGEKKAEDLKKALNTGLSGTYTVTVKKDGKLVDVQEYTNKPISFDTLSLNLPKFEDVGKYDYNVKITFTDSSENKNRASNQAVIETNATLIIDPVLELSVKKDLKGRDWKNSDRFDFTLSGGNGVLPENRTASVKAKDEIVSFGQIKFNQGGNYTFTVEETEGTEPEMTYAGPQDVTVNVAWSDDQPATIKGDGIVRDETGNVYRKTLTFTNTYCPSSLTVSKTIQGTGAEDAGDKEFTFDVTFTEIQGGFSLAVGSEYKTASGSADVGVDSYVPIQSEGQTVRIGLHNGGSRKLDGIPLGVKYTVSEEQATGYVSSTTTASGQIDAKGNPYTASFTNYKTGSLKVSKTVEIGDDTDPSEVPTGKEFTIVVDLSLPTGTSREKTVELKLKDGESRTITGLPAGTSYKVSEILDDTHYVASYSDGGQGTIPNNGGEQTVEVTNTYYNVADGTGMLTFGKTITGKTGNSVEQEYKFRVTFTEPRESEYKETYRTFIGQLGNNPKTYSLKAGKSQSITGIPVGTSYVVKEILTDLPDSAKPSSVTAMLSPFGSKESDTVVRDDGTVRGKINENRDVDSITFSNNYLANLTLEIVFPDQNTRSIQIPGDARFTFNLSFSGLAPDEVAGNMRIKDADGTHGSDVLFKDFADDDAVTIAVTKNNPIAYVYDIPIGVSHYTITENSGSTGASVTYNVGSERDPNPDYTGQSTGDQIFSLDTDYVTFMNTYQEPFPGWLTVRKTVRGAAPNGATRYTFRISSAEGNVTDRTMEIAAGDSQSISLPAGTYTVEETTVGNFTTKIDGRTTKTVDVKLEGQEVWAVNVVNTYTANNGGNGNNPNGGNIPGGNNGGEFHGGGGGGNGNGSLVGNPAYVPDPNGPVGPGPTANSPAGPLYGQAANPAGTAAEPVQSLGLTTAWGETLAPDDKTSANAPSKGSGSSKTSKASKTGGTPRTGDDSNLKLWIALMMVSIAGAFSVIFFRRKKGKGGNDGQAG